MKTLFITSNSDIYSIKKNFEANSLVDYCDKNNIYVRYLSSNDMCTLDEENLPTAYYNFSGYPNEQHFRYLRYLELNNVKTINPIYNQRIASDKMLSGLELKYNGIPIVETISLGSIFFDNQKNIVNQVETKIGFPCVIKAPNLGRGISVIKCDTKLNFLEILGLIFSTDTRRFGQLSHNNFIVQKFIASTAGKCIRTYTLDNEVIACMTRTNDTYWKVNLNDGGTRTIIKEIPNQLINMSLTINKVLNLNFSGIDFHITDNGYVFNEINPIPDFEVISKLIPSLNIGEKLCETLFH